MLLAALGHDLYEDTEFPPRDTVNDYGWEVDHLIRGLTEEDGVAEYVERMATGLEEARLIKLSNGIDNYGGLVTNKLVWSEPAKWVDIVRRHMEPMFSWLESVPFRKYPAAGRSLSEELATKREEFWAVVRELLRKSNGNKSVGSSGPWS